MLFGGITSLLVDVGLMIVGYYVDYTYPSSVYRIGDISIPFIVGVVGTVFFILDIIRLIVYYLKK